MQKTVNAPPEVTPKSARKLISALGSTREGLPRGASGAPVVV